MMLNTNIIFSAWHGVCVHRHVALAGQQTFDVSTPANADTFS